MNTTTTEVKPVKFTISYGTIKNMNVEIPISQPFVGAKYGYNADTLVQSFANGFVEYMTGNGLVSDDVLFSSIGASNCRKGMKLGFNEQPNTDKVKEIFNRIMDCDTTWRNAVLQARYGDEIGLRKGYELDGISEENINMLMGHLFKD